jgi:hypothetical protein
MGFLMFLSFTSMIVSSVIIYKKFEFKESNGIHLSIVFLNIIFDFIVLVIILLFGIHSLIYSSISKLEIYVKFLFVIISLEIFMEICYFFNNSEITNVKLGKNLLFIITCFKIIFRFINIIFIIKEKNKINQEIKSSPLNNIDDFISEDLYHNIIKMSKNPNDISLIKDYEKLSKRQSKQKNSSE